MSVPVSTLFIPSAPPLLPLFKVGVVDVADDEVIKKGRLMPGNIFLVDFDEHRVVEDTEASVCTGWSRTPWRVCARECGRGWDRIGAVWKGMAYGCPVPIAPAQLRYTPPCPHLTL